MIIKFVNLTPHRIGFQFPDGTRIDFPSVGIARVDTIVGEPTTIDFNGREMIVTSPIMYGEVLGLPEPEEGTIYIVSQIVLTQPSVAGRCDVVAPATGPKDQAIRYADGPQKGLIDAVTRWLPPPVLVL